MLLDGVRVLDFSRLLPGPYATMLLADQGAEVIKVEPPGGPDPARATPLFGAVNRHKRSILVDYRQPAGRDLCLRLARDCDLLVESFRPGVAAALGLDYAAVRAVNPRLVYLSLTGWGQTGPLRDLAGHDLNCLSMAGVLGVTGAAGRGPVIPGVQMADLGGGMLAAFGAVSALLRARTTGVGVCLDVAMFDLLVSWLTLPATFYSSGGPPAGWGDALLSGGVVCYNLYETADGGWMALAALEPKFWSRFCAAVERPDLAGAAFDPARPGVASFEAVRALFRGRPRAAWERLGREADCCLTPVLSLPEALRSEHVQARGMWWEGAGGAPAHPAHPLTAGAERGRGPGAAPAAGADTDAVLRRLGLGDAELAALRQAGVIG